MNIYFQTNELKTLLTAQYFKLNQHNIIIENRRKRFSFDDSFLVDGQSFDCGYHSIDIGRNEIFSNILDSLEISWVTTPGSRMMLFNNQSLRRGYSLQELAGIFSLDNQSLYRDAFLNRLEEYYGSDFIRFVLDEIVPTYTQNSYWKELGLPYEEVLKNIYPWFFPSIDNDDYRMIPEHYHNASVNNSSVRYPSSGGFIKITQNLREILAPYMEEPKNDNQYRFTEFDEHGKLLTKREGQIVVGPINHKEIADRYSLPYPVSKKANFYLVNIIFKNQIEIDVNEYLVGDKKYFFDRVSSPDLLEGERFGSRLQFECENFSAISDEALVSNIKEFTKKYFDEDDFHKIDIKKVVIDRYDTTNIEGITNNILEFIEHNNKDFIVSNRSFSYENLAGGVPDLIHKIQECASEKT